MANNLPDVQHVGRNRARQICLSIGEDGVQEDEVGLHLFGEVERLHAPVGGQHLEAVVRELLLEVGPHGTFMLNQQNRSSHHGADASNPFAGRQDVLWRGKIQFGAREAQPTHCLSGGRFPRSPVPPLEDGHGLIVGFAQRLSSAADAQAADATSRYPTPQTLRM
jgi:hypothetical protein